MKTISAVAFASAFLALCISCSNADKERAHDATAKSEQELKKLGAEAKTEAKALNSKMNQALQGGKADASASSSNAEQKLDHAGAELKAAGSRAGVKLTQAAMIAKVKAKLASDIGVTTVASVNVDSDGSVVTLSGSVPSQETKRQIEQSAGAVDGVTKVINHLTVKP